MKLRIKIAATIVKENKNPLSFDRGCIIINTLGLKVFPNCFQPIGVHVLLQLFLILSPGGVFG